MDRNRILYWLIGGILDEAIFGWLIRGGIVGIGASLWAYFSAIPPVIIALIGLWAFVGIIALLSFLKWSFRGMPKQILGAQFFSQRPSPYWFEQQVNSARDLWAAWLIGGSARNYRLLKKRRFRRLILLHPDCASVRAINEVQPSYEFEELAKTIRDLSSEAQGDGCEVRWCRDITYSLITIGNAPTDSNIPPEDMWAICESWIPGISASQRPSFKVERKYNQELADNILLSFQQLWNHCEEAVISS